MGIRCGGCGRGPSASPRVSALLMLAREALEQPLDLAVLLGLAVGPFPDHLLLGAHMRDQPLDRFGEIGHCRGRGAAAAVLDRRAQPFERGLHVAGGRSVAAIFANRGGEPARPNSEDEKEMPMPPSGRASPCLSVSNNAPASPPTFRS